MYRVTNLSLSLDGDEGALKSRAAEVMGISTEQVESLQVSKKSVDARDKGDVHFVYAVDVRLRSGVAPSRKALAMGRVQRIESRVPLSIRDCAVEKRPLVVGAGPGGLFAAYVLAKAGANPLLIERGKPVDARRDDVETFFKTGALRANSNVQFGEGGAGAFSDGKLTTGIKSPYCRHVLETFVECGAPEEILYLQKPHIGTDKLRGVVAALRNRIISLGGEVRFETCLHDLVVDRGRVRRAVLEGTEGKQALDTDHVFLAIGHSARDTYHMLYRAGVPMAQKPFSVGARIEHPQALVNKAQYGAFASHPALGAAEYKLSATTGDGRGVYTFCMCPGGYVVAAASRQGGVVTNGMSLHARAGENANAALLVGIRPEDFQDDHPLAGLVFQQAIEEAAFREGGGGFMAPVQRVEDFLAGRPSRSIGGISPTYRPGVTPGDLARCLPAYVIADMRRGIQEMDKRLRGFAHPDALLTGVETRSSSPVRIMRDEGGESSLSGLYPIGEGAGYAGGIVSAAVDGMGAAMKALERRYV